MGPGATQGISACFRAVGMISWNTREGVIISLQHRLRRGAIARWALAAMLMLVVFGSSGRAARAGSGPACEFCVDGAILGVGSMFNIRLLTLQWDWIRWSVLDAGAGLDLPVAAFTSHVGTTAQARVAVAGSYACWLSTGLWWGRSVRSLGGMSLLTGETSREGVWLPLGIEWSERLAEGEAIWGIRFVVGFQFYGGQTLVPGLFGNSDPFCPGSEPCLPPVMTGLELFLGF